MKLLRPILKPRFMTTCERIRRQAEVETVYPPERYLPNERNRLFPDRKFEQRDLDGVVWADAQLPPRNHVCWAQTRAYTDWVRLVERCACGAIRRDGPKWGVWDEVNQTRDSRGAKA